MLNVLTLNKKIQGVSNARNTGIRVGKGKIVAFLDSDDIWLPSKLEKQIEALKKNNSKICFTNVIFKSGNSEIIANSDNIIDSCCSIEGLELVLKKNYMCKPC